MPVTTVLNQSPSVERCWPISHQTRVLNPEFISWKVEWCLWLSSHHQAELIKSATNLGKLISMLMVQTNVGRAGCHFPAGLNYPSRIELHPELERCIFREDLCARGRHLLVKLCTASTFKPLNNPWPPFSFLSCSFVVMVIYKLLHFSHGALITEHYCQ